MRILVVGGGFSRERDISLLSSKAVYEALQTTDYDVDYLDWNGDMQQLVDACEGIELVVPVLHGIGGEDGQIQAILEDLNIKYVGTDASVSKLCIDKQATKQKLADNNILTPKGTVLDYDGYKQSDISKSSHVVKPVNEGSSFDTFIIHDQPSPELAEKIKSSFETNKQMLVEEYVKGIEITVPILEGKELPVIEIIPPEGQWFDYANKYNGETKEACPPINLSSELQGQAIKLAKQVHATLGARHLSRVDMIVQGEDIYVLELNTIPGMTNESLFPKAAKYIGLDMAALMTYLVELADKDQDTEAQND
jgi:D-alanine-D-alanine ligase